MPLTTIDSDSFRAADPLLQEAIRQFEAALGRATDAKLLEPTAAVLATVNERGFPSTRAILVRGYDERGFVFFTNSASRKGQELAANPVASLCFYWDPIHEQVRIEGAVETTTDADSDAYWASRRRDSQIGAWASDQSAFLARRELLEEAVAARELEFRGRDVPRPPHWHGYRVLPTRIEIWKGLPARLHERTIFEKQGGVWTTFMLYP